MKKLIMLLMLLAVQANATPFVVARPPEWIDPNEISGFELRKTLVACPNDLCEFSWLIDKAPAGIVITIEFLELPPGANTDPNTGKIEFATPNPGVYYFKAYFTYWADAEMCLAKHESYEVMALLIRPLTDPTVETAAKVLGQQ